MSASRRPPRFSVWCRTRCGSGGQPGRSALDEVYGDPPIFFANTYATSGLKSLMLEGLSRVTGANAGGAAVIRLETSSGGGKTHNLIALYHLCRGGVDPKNAASFVSPKPMPTKPIERIAGVVGPDMDVAKTQSHAQSSTVAGSSTTTVRGTESKPNHRCGKSATTRWAGRQDQGEERTHRAHSAVAVGAL